MTTTTHTRRDEAAYRVLLKRIIRSCRASMEMPDGDNLEEQARRIVTKDRGESAARALEALFRRAAKAWEDGNNSGNNEGLGAGEAECDRLRGIAERFLALYDVKVDYPGLYPSFEWRGHHYYTPESLFHFIATEGRPQ